jgi:soluble lytic murein transglycosylase-like protein
MTFLAANRPLRAAFFAGLALAVALACPCPARAGAQAEEYMAPSVVAGLAAAVADQPVPADYARRADVASWIAEMSRRLASRVPGEAERIDLLATVHYEATRAGLDPELVLGVIHHESAFRKYAVSSADARGYMQVMPFWTRLIGTAQQNLFHLRTNLRYGCTILRHYLAMENGDVYRALGRYNGSLGRAEYPSAVMTAAARYRVPAVQSVYVAVPTDAAPTVMPVSAPLPASTVRAAGR